VIGPHITPALPRQGRHGRIALDALRADDRKIHISASWHHGIVASLHLCIVMAVIGWLIN
jgi:hypothetical protein